MKKQQSKPFWEMTAAERTEAVKKYDKPIPRSKVKKLTKPERERFERARAGPSGSIIATPAKKKKITLQVNEFLLVRIDRLAEERGITREEIVERGVRGLLTFVI